MVHVLADVTIAATNTPQQLSATTIRAYWVEVFSKTGNNTSSRIGDSLTTSSRGAPIIPSTSNNTPFYFPPCSSTDTYDLSAIWINGTQNDVYYVIYGTI